MTTDKKEIPTHIFASINKALSKLGVSASDNYLREILKDTDLEKTFIEDGIFDTCEREWFMDMFAMKLTGQEWPCNADSEEYSKEFWSKLVEAIKAEKEITVLE